MSKEFLLKTRHKIIGICAGVYLAQTSFTYIDKKGYYKLNIDVYQFDEEIAIIHRPKDKWKKTKTGGYFYHVMCKNPLVYAFRHELPPSSIQMGKLSLWYGTTGDFSKSLNADLFDISINNGSNMVVPRGTIKRLLSKYFPGLEYELDDNRILIYTDRNGIETGI